jgi:alkanesulfonate monooxygenase SsuD/methylene tetrahydromethanopterin reductase-like flavin-dependent oxidoreductase (luciferase family)
MGYTTAGRGSPRLFREPPEVVAMSAARAEVGPIRRVSRLSVGSWVLYDLANTIFSLSIVSVYFSLWVVHGMGGTQLQYGLANGLSMALVFITAPALGALSDQSPRRVPFLILGTLGCVGFTLLLGTGVALMVERDPIITAKAVASLDLVTGGRVIFGIGVGWNREKMENHGTDPRTRGRLMDERIRAMIEIWTRDAAEFHGQYVDFDPIGAWPKPLQRPHPPIYVGGGSRAFNRIAEYGDA